MFIVGLLLTVVCAVIWGALFVGVLPTEIAATLGSVPFFVWPIGIVLGGVLMMIGRRPGD